jgi:hypothetical protein
VAAVSDEIIQTIDRYSLVVEASVASSLTRMKADTPAYGREWILVQIEFKSL